MRVGYILDLQYYLESKHELKERKKILGMGMGEGMGYLGPRGARL
jgi:hypothetical protein